VAPLTHIHIGTLLYWTILCRATAPGQSHVRFNHWKNRRRSGFSRRQSVRTAAGAAPTYPHAAGRLNLRTWLIHADGRVRPAGPKGDAGPWPVRGPFHESPADGVGVDIVDHRMIASDPHPALSRSTGRGREIRPHQTLTLPVCR
jgi:hypothetical protein